MVMNPRISFAVTHNSTTLLLKRYNATIMLAHVLSSLGLIDTQASTLGNKYNWPSFIMHEYIITVDNFVYYIHACTMEFSNFINQKA